MTCSCRKFAPSPDCDRPEHTAPDRRVSSPAFYEERIRQLESEKRRAEDALRKKASQPCVFVPGDIPCHDEWPATTDQWCAPCFSRYVLSRLGAL